MLGKDMKSFPDKVASLTLTTATATFPPNLGSLKPVPLLFGVVFAGAIAVALWLPWVREPFAAGWERARRVGAALIAAALAVSCLFAATLAFVWMPRLAGQFSYKNLFDRYRALADGGEPLGVMGMSGSGPEYYARGAFEPLRNRSDLITMLKRDQRVFALAPASELCALHQAAPQSGFSYHVLDDSHEKFLLLSNRVADGQTDHNPLSRMILRERPADIRAPLSITFEDQIELIGVNMPEQVKRGDEFEMTLFFRVLAKPKRSWQIFVHFDGGGVRFQGDHWPVNNRCGTTFWQPGDYVVDTFKVTAGNMTFAKAAYQAWVGMFVGSSGNWTNMKVTAGDHDTNNRVSIGSIQVR
jgi:hypothetical protein